MRAWVSTKPSTGSSSSAPIPSSSLRLFTACKGKQEPTNQPLEWKALLSLSLPLSWLSAWYLTMFAMECSALSLWRPAGFEPACPWASGTVGSWTKRQRPSGKVRLPWPAVAQGALHTHASVTLLPLPAAYVDDSHTSEQDMS